MQAAVQAGCAQVRYLEQYSQRALAQGAAAGPGRGRTTVVKVDGDGVVLDEQV